MAGAARRFSERSNQITFARSYHRIVGEFYEFLPLFHRFFKIVTIQIFGSVRAYFTGISPFERRHVYKYSLPAELLSYRAQIAKSELKSKIFFPPHQTL